MKTSISSMSKVCAAILLGLLAVGGLGVASVKAADDKTPPPPRVDAAYILQPSDELAITVGPVTKYDTAGAIAPDGIIYLKGVGDLRAAGLTIPELREAIRKVMATRLKSPLVGVTLTKLAPPLPPNKITVVGSVVTPGPRDLEPGLRVAKAIELAGGQTKDADLTKVVLIHRNLTRKEIDLGTPAKISDDSQNVMLADGDSIYVSAIPPKEMINLTIGGAVVKAGPLQLDEAPRVLKAIDLAGGMNKDADLSKVSILHKDLSVTTVNLANAKLAADPAHNILLKDGDSVTIPSQLLTVSIVGAVISAGTYDLKPGMGLDDLLLAAGKMNIMADTEHVEFRRVGEPSKIINLAERFQPGQPKLALMPGDQVIIQEYKDRVLVAGVGAAGGYRPLVPGQTVWDFFQDAENAAILDTTKLDLGKTKLSRKGKPAAPINLKKIINDPKDKQNVELASGDVIWLEGKSFGGASPIGPAVGILGVLARFIAV